MPDATSPTRADSTHLRRFLAAGLAFALLTGLAFPPLALWPLAILAPAPIAWAALVPCPQRPTRRADRLRWRALAILLGVLPLWIVEQRWLINVAGLWYILLALYLAIFPALAVALTAALQRRARRPLPRHLAPAAFAIIWTGLETLRGEVIWGGYAWFLASHPLIDSPGARAASALGTYAVSLFLVGCVASLVLAAPRADRRRGLASAAAFAGAWLLACLIAPSPASTPASATPRALPVARVALVQTNVAQDNKEAWRLEQQRADFARFLALTRQAAASNPDLIVWPETMFPGLALDPDSLAAERAAALSWRIKGPPGSPDTALPSTVYADELLALQRELNIPILVGCIAYDRLDLRLDDAGRVKLAHDGKFNAAILLRDGRPEPDRYEKLELMAFGEVIPYVWRWKGLQQWVGSLGAAGWVFDLHWGRRTTAFAVPIRAAALDDTNRPAPALRFVTPICFEGSMPRVCRRLVRASLAEPSLPAGAIINISNDGWFGSAPGGREVHILTLRWRALELGLPVLRAVNTGLSAVIAPDGRLSSTLPPWTDGVLVADIPIPDAPASGIVSFLTLGNAVGWLCLGLTALAALLIVFPARATGRSSPA